MSQTVKFRVFRMDPKGGGKPRFQDYDVPYVKGMTVLEALFHIQGELDPSLCFRSSCRAGVCGSCAMHVGGRYRLACETQASIGLESRVTIRPLAHLEIIRDLVVDMAPFWDHYRRILPYLIPADRPPETERPQTPTQREQLDPMIDCILCSSCHASCPMTASDPQYIGPAALMKANRFVVDSRDGDAGERLHIVGDEHGVFRCHTVFNCSRACPKDLDPAGSIAHLKRLAVTDYVRKPESR